MAVELDPVTLADMTDLNFRPRSFVVFWAVFCFGTTLAWTNAGEAPVRKTRLVILGDSLSAGFGVERDQSFPALLQMKIDRAGRPPCEVVNAGVSGDTSASGLRRVDWVLRGGVDFFILELGGNDGLRGIPPLATKANLQTIIDKVRKANPDVKIVIAGMRMPPSVGKEFEGEFARVFSDLANANQVTLIPFLLEGVAGDPKLNQPDMIHPTRQGHEIVAETVWRFLEPMLTSAQRPRAGQGLLPK